MSEGRVVYEGQTALGPRTIREGDFVEFRISSYSYNNGTVWKGIAFYSNKYTLQNQRDGAVCVRLPDYDYGSDHENCHSWSKNFLITHIPVGPKEVRRSGFGRWIAKVNTNVQDR